MSRTPTTMAEALVLATEWNLATLELQMLRSSSRARIRRQADICRALIQSCQRFIGEDDLQMGAFLLDAIRLRAILDGREKMP